MKRDVRRMQVDVPAWARDAIWYQVFPERFRNGCPASNPTREDIGATQVPGWRISRWGMDWYDRTAWERRGGGFFRSVLLRRYGGDLVGLRDKLDYLQDLGINAIYLNPIFTAPSLHKYDASSMHHIDPTLGPDRAGDLKALRKARETEDPATWIWTAADRCFIDLVQEVHRRGMRIIIDGVFNHTGRGFFAFQDLLEHGARSRYRDWYCIEKWLKNGSFRYKGWFGHQGLPELGRSGDNLCPPVREYIFNITRRWMDPEGTGDRACGIDGWRLDVAFCVPHGFWKEWRRHVKSINPDAFVCGEIVSLAREFLRGDELDAVMNYMWTYPTLSFFSPGREPMGARALRRQLAALLKAYPEPVNYVLQNLLDSHDVGRVLSMLENPDVPKGSWDDFFNASRVKKGRGFSTKKPGPKAVQALKQCVVFQMTYLGAPMIYYGTEVGMWGANDPDNRQPMLWDDIRYDREQRTPWGRCGPSTRAPDGELLQFFRKAIVLRRQHEVLRRGRLEWVRTANDRLLGFRRADDRSQILILLNASDTELPFRLRGRHTDLWDAGGTLDPGTLTVPARGWKVLGA